MRAAPELDASCANFVYFPLGGVVCLNFVTESTPGKSTRDSIAAAAPVIEYQWIGAAQTFHRLTHRGISERERFRAMRALLPAVLLLAFTSAAHASPAGDSVMGRWKTQSGHGIVELARCGTSVCGKIVGGSGGEPLDVKNKNAALRTRQLVGLTMMSGYRETAKGWAGGTIYNPEDGGAYGSELKPGPSGTLLVKGCFGVLCRTQTWTKAP